jgi:hypothetical protein
MAKLNITHLGKSKRTSRAQVKGATSRTNGLIKEQFRIINSRLVHSNWLCNRAWGTKILIITSAA